MKDYKIRFVENLKLFMKDKNVNQTDLANAIGVHQTTVSAWLLGQNEPPFSKVCLIVDFFGCDFKDFTE